MNLKILTLLAAIGFFAAFIISVVFFYDSITSYINMNKDYPYPLKYVISNLVSTFSELTMCLFLIGFYTKLKKQ